MKFSRAQLAALALCGVVLSSTGEAREFEVFENASGEPVFKVEYYGASDLPHIMGDNNIWMLDNSNLAGEFTLANKKSLHQAFTQWTELFAKDVKQPVQFLVGKTNLSGNASAVEIAIQDKKIIYGGGYIGDIIQNGREAPPVDLYAQELALADGVVVGKIDIGSYLGEDSNGNKGWEYSEITPLPNVEKGVDLAPVMFHEIAHALGINSANSQIIDDKTSWMSPSLSNFDQHLADQDGVLSSKDRIIISSSELPADAPRDEYFVIDNKFYDLKKDNLGRAFFIGDNVKEALGGAKIYGMEGIPIKGYEPYDDNNLLDLSHLELERSMMSHQNYRNYNSFMEAELAVFQDLGYEIDRKNFYGRSIYGDKQNIENTQGFFGRNASGTAYVDGSYNNSTYGVGLHIYGQQNKIIQKGDILTQGTAAVGIRVDSVKNTLTVAEGTKVHADGRNGVGVLVAYGSGHQVNIDGEVRALGEKGAALAFDFGANGIGMFGGYRGSYIFYKRVIDDTGTVFGSGNQPLFEPDKFNPYDDSFTTKDDLRGAMANAKITGTLLSRGDAIHIAKNAFVEKLDVEKGAKIIGDITSDWKHFETEDGFFDAKAGNDAIKQLKIQYEVDGTVHYVPYDKYIPALVTSLIFNGDVDYQGRINGRDNMKLHVTSGTLNYTGEADVVKVDVKEGASVLGGSFKLNKITEDKLYKTDIAPANARTMDKPTDVSYDDGTGIFTNAGTLGANKDNNLKISGTLNSTGTLQGYGGLAEPAILVDGDAQIDGNKITVTNALPGEEVTVLSVTGTLTGSVANGEETPLQATGMLNTTAVVEEKNIFVQTTESDNLGERTDVENTFYAGVKKKARLAGLRPGEEQELRTIYSLAANDAKATFSNLGRAKRVANYGFSDTQQKRASLRTLAKRLTEDEVGAWYRTSKAWGENTYGANYHGSTIAGGYDWGQDTNKRTGLFVAYSTSSYGGAGSENVYDTRVGVYHGSKQGASSWTLYGDVGFIRGKESLTRSVANLAPVALSGKYSGHIVEVGAKYAYDLQAGKDVLWHVSPYVETQLSYAQQNAYTEQGDSILGYRIDGKSNVYVGVEPGVEFTRNYANGDKLRLAVGVHQALCGASPEFTAASLLADYKYSLTNERDKTAFTFALGGEKTFSKRLSLQGDIVWQKSAHAHELGAAVQLRYTF